MTDCSDAMVKTEGGFALPQAQADSAVAKEFVTSDGARHFMRFWPGSPARPVVVYLHGIEGHSRWFESTALALNNTGMFVYAPDRRGAGANPDKRGDMLSSGRLLADVDELLQQITARHPSSPVFLFGNCWGGKLAITLAAQERAQPLAGLILTSPAVDTQVDVSLLTKLKIALNYLLAGGQGYFDIPLSSRHFTDNPPYLQYVENDPLRLRQATARFFIESLKLTRACRKATPRLRLKVLVLQSGRDAIVNLGGLKRWFAQVGSLDKTLKIFTTAAHSLDFEPDQADYQSLLVGWINAQACSQVSA